ncbi:MAG: hypothetical protein HC849_18065 [Oscillatoriales cyanobacterium RU_3_3]|nr:hypothetical protein [Microcoleus sp. SM1_3_4]NJM61667.1 hypothetical protein [Oscillatoriales cyanobacterium RU_3_3]NJR21076.1 hypothetical protein [Richelia sp. CSU_2_1]
MPGFRCRSHLIQIIRYQRFSPIGFGCSLPRNRNSRTPFPGSGLVRAFADLGRAGGSLDLQA